MTLCFQWYAYPQDLHSFPTRRSSDLSLDATVRRPVITALRVPPQQALQPVRAEEQDRKSTRLNSSHMSSSYAVFCLKKKTDNTGLLSTCARKPRSPRKWR